VVLVPVVQHLGAPRPSRREVGGPTVAITSRPRATAICTLCPTPHRAEVTNTRSRPGTQSLQTLQAVRPAAAGRRFVRRNPSGARARARRHHQVFGVATGRAPQPKKAKPLARLRPSRRRDYLPTRPAPPAADIGSRPRQAPPPAGSGHWDEPGLACHQHSPGPGGSGSGQSSRPRRPRPAGRGTHAARTAPA